MDYFPLDVHIFEDEKIEAISGEFGTKGELVVIKLLCAVYEKGYFVVWNDLTKSKLLRRVPGASKELLDQIVHRLVAWEFFNEDLFNSVKVLTSENIQATYFEATKRRKQQKPTKYIINDNNNSQASEVNTDINAQIKRNKSKGKETKVSSSEHAGDDSVLNSVQSFQQLWNFPNVVQQNTLMEFIDLYGDGLVDAAIKVAGSKDVNKSKSIAFIESCLKEWSDANVKTIEQAREYQRTRNTKRQSNYQSQPTRKEELPKWAKDDYEQSQEEEDPELLAEMERKRKEYLKGAK